MTLRLTRLTLTEFRNYPALTWRPGARISVVTGPNGSGKTNLLEAISLLVPGRGLRNARIGEFGRNVPFSPKRYFLVSDVPSAATRGEHAHRVCEQFLVCISGRVAVLVDDGSRREEIELDNCDIGLYVPPRVWALQYKYSRSCVLLVFASHFYDAADYIRDYQQFLQECATDR